MSSKSYVLKMLSSHVRLFLSLAVAVLAYFFLPVTPVERSIAAWNIGTIVYLILVTKMMFSSSQKIMETRANEDEGKFLILVLALIAVIVSLVAITYELTAAKNMTSEKTLHIGMAAFTILSSWLFIHTVYALHYAHDYYDKVPGGYAEGLVFPNTRLPAYTDFLYFSFIIGTSAQTADINISSQSMRRVTLIHCVLSFFFNTTLLALTINIASSLF